MFQTSETQRRLVPNLAELLFLFSKVIVVLFCILFITFYMKTLKHVMLLIDRDVSLLEL